MFCNTHSQTDLLVANSAGATGSAWRTCALVGIRFVLAGYIRRIPYRLSSQRSSKASVTFHHLLVPEVEAVSRGLSIINKMKLAFSKKYTRLFQCEYA